MQPSKKKIINKKTNLLKKKLSRSLFCLIRDPKNLDKSRYRDVIPGESTRVKLQPDGEDKHDFINANYVSGYNNQEKAYIFTQGKRNIVDDAS